MIVFREATSEHVLSIHPNPRQANFKTIECGQEAFRSGVVPLSGCSRSIHLDGECCGAYGIVQMWPGVGRIWGLFSESLLRNYPHVLALHAKRDVNLAVSCGYDRIEATCDPEHLEAIRFLEWLGFDREGLMRRYHPSGSDNYLYARINDDLPPGH